MGARTAAQRRVGEAVPGKAWMEPDDDVYGHPPIGRARRREKRKWLRLLARLQRRGTGGGTGRTG